MFDRRFLANVNLLVLGVANSPAASPTVGTQYIVGSEATGAFAGAVAGSIARYDGTDWKFIAPKAGGFEVVNAATSEVLAYNGTAWVTVAALGGDSTIAPVKGILATGTTLPASADEGDKFLKTDDAKVYTATATDTWNSGVATSDGDRYASLTDFKIYESDGSAVSGSDIPDGAFFYNTADHCAYVYDGTDIAGITSSSTVAGAITETHTLTAAEVTANGFTLTNSVATGSVASTLLFLSGVAQVYGTDYTVSGNAVSWQNKALADFGLRAGDTFIIHYVKA